MVTLAAGFCILVVSKDALSQFSKTFGAKIDNRNLALQFPSDLGLYLTLGMSDRNSKNTSIFSGYWARIINDRTIWIICRFQPENVLVHIFPHIFVFHSNLVSGPDAASKSTNVAQQI